MHLYNFAFIPILALTLITSIQGQLTNPRPSVFIDCQMHCDLDYIRQQITFVDYMQDREEADIYILTTQQVSGSGGREIQLTFMGNHSYTAIRDTVRFYTDPNATFAINRDQLVDQLKKGLLQFIIQSPLIDHLTYNVTIKDTSGEITSSEDPWNNWVFNIGGNGWLDREATYTRLDLTGRFSASMVTDRHKFVFSSYYNNQHSTFNLVGGTESFTRKSYNLNMLYVKSLGPNWSAGFRASTGSTTFGNMDISTTLKPAIEYNFYPYSEASTRRFSINYAFGPEYYNYTDTTIFDKISETRIRHGLRISYSQTQKWGSMNINFGIQQYLHNLELYNAYINPNVQWQIFKGLSINFGGFISFVRDRINIAKADITDEDILLNIKQLDTDFTFFTYFGLNYRFGSDFNNYVNPRF